MDLTFSEEDRAFQEEVRAWIKENYTEDLRERNRLSKNGYLDKDSIVTWQKRLNEKGWAAPNWPVEYGGPGFTPNQKYIFSMEMSLAGTPTTSPMGFSMVAPVIMAFGSDEQKAEHLPKILNSDIWWCQGYSEPGSGSDLASLAMTAVRDGDDYVLNGSKIWTTHAQWADWMFCLVRTSKEEKRQEGISFILLRMDTPGISIRPIITADMPLDGQQEVNQVFFENVRVPVSNRIGEEGKGWTYAKYLLQFERGNAYSPGLRHMLKKVRKIAKTEESEGTPLITDPDFARKVSEIEIAVEALDFTERRIFSKLSAGDAVGPESSMLKCHGSELQQSITELVLEAAGRRATPQVRNSWAHLDGANEPPPVPDSFITAAPSYFNYRKTSIYAGSNEIQRNIMAKLILGVA